MMRPMRKICNRRIMIVRYCAAMLLSALVLAGACSREQGTRYHCPDSGFSISFPKEWNIKENALGTRILAELPEEEGVIVIRQNVNVVVEDSTAAIDLKEYMDQQIGGLQKLKGMKLLDKGEGSIDGTTARWCIYSCSINDFGYQALVYTLKRNRRYYTITAISQLNNFPKYENVFRTVVKSFKFE